MTARTRSMYSSLTLVMTALRPLLCMSDMASSSISRVSTPSSGMTGYMRHLPGMRMRI